MQVTPSPSPSTPALQPIAPNIDLTWFWEGLGSVACIALTVVLAVIIYRRLRDGYGFHPGILAGGLASLGFAIWWGIDGTNHLWPELRPYSVYGVLGIIVLTFFVFTMSND